MRVLIINTSEKNGGAAVAANRLMEALNNNGEKAKMLVRDKSTSNISVVGLKGRLWQRWHFLWERWCIFFRLYFSREHLFAVDIANAGTDVTRLREFKEADVIHLHWVNQGMLSLRGIRRILASGKPVVWTMHDIWPATGICHLTLGCTRFKTGGCRYCKYLPGGGSQSDLANKIWRRKKDMLQHHTMFFVACSRWLAGEAKASTLLKGQHIESIPNPIDTRVYRPTDRREARRQCSLPEDKRIILFVSQRATNPYKGMDYLSSACKKLIADHPEMKDEVCVAVLGGHAEEVVDMLPFKAYPLGYVSDDREIVKVYNAADVFVLPSLSENLPNTIMEAMACGVPCVGFNVGGIPEMIDHKRNGYVAAYKMAGDLAEGLRWVLYESDARSLSECAIRKVSACYSQQAVAMKYVEVYNQALAVKHYRL